MSNWTAAEMPGRAQRSVVRRGQCRCSGEYRFEQRRDVVRAGDAQVIVVEIQRVPIRIDAAANAVAQPPVRIDPQNPVRLAERVQQLKGETVMQQEHGMAVASSSDPAGGDLIKETGGLRKMRYADSRRGKGKRGGLRVIYYWWEDGSQFWLFTLYGKNEADDLSARERRELKDLVKLELAARSRT